MCVANFQMVQPEKKLWYVLERYSKYGKILATGNLGQRYIGFHCTILSTFP